MHFMTRDVTDASIQGVRILMLLDNSCSPDPRVEREATALATAGAHVSILCWDRDGSAPLLETHRGYEIERIVIPAKRQLGLRQLANLCRFYSEAWRRLQDRQFHVVHAHDLLMLPLGVAVARRAAVPLVYDAHEIYHVM